MRDWIAPENLGRVLGQYLSAGDLLIDLAWNIDCCEIVQWCHDHGVLYINTSVEVWDPYDRSQYEHPTQCTVLAAHAGDALQQLRARWNEPGPTAVLEHGGEPRLDLALYQADLRCWRLASACWKTRRVTGAGADEGAPVHYGPQLQPFSDETRREGYSLLGSPHAD